MGQTKLYSILYLSNLIALFDCFRLNQIGEKIRFGVFTFTVSTTVFSLEHHCSHKIKTKIIIPSIQNQNSLLMKWQTDSIIPGGGGR